MKEGMPMEKNWDVGRGGGENAESAKVVVRLKRTKKEVLLWTI